MSLPNLPVIELPVTAFRLELTRWLAAVEKGERLVVTVGRRPVAVISSWPRHVAAAEAGGGPSESP